MPRLLLWQVPEFRVSYAIVTDKLDALYQQLKPKGVTMTALLAKACGVALAKHPLLYAGEAWQACMAGRQSCSFTWMLSLCMYAAPLLWMSLWWVCKLNACRLGCF